MIAAVPVPPAIFCPAPLPSRKVMVWGDQAAMEKMRVAFERKGWTWATMVLGGQTNALALGPPDGISDAAICTLVNDVNAGKFGKLNAGFASFGSPAPSRKERGRS
jgi:hypothetical protein